MNEKSRQRIIGYPMADIYRLYLQKIVRKGRSQEELDQAICWLTGYDKEGLRDQLDAGHSLEEFLIQAPLMNPKAEQIRGLICGVRVEEIEDPLIQQIRWMDKLVDELAKGKAMEKILRDA